MKRAVLLAALTLAALVAAGCSTDDTSATASNQGADDTEVSYEANFSNEYCAQLFAFGMNHADEPTTPEEYNAAAVAVTTLIDAAPPEIADVVTSWATQFATVARHAGDNNVGFDDAALVAIDIDQFQSDAQTLSQWTATNCPELFDTPGNASSTTEAADPEQ